MKYLGKKSPYTRGDFMKEPIVGTGTGNPTEVALGELAEFRRSALLEAADVLDDLFKNPLISNEQFKEKYPSIPKYNEYKQQWFYDLAVITWVSRKLRVSASEEKWKEELMKK